MKNRKIELGQLCAGGRPQCLSANLRMVTDTNEVIERGISGPPRVMNEGEVEPYYCAGSNPDDPAIGKVAGGNALSSVAFDNV